jgi:tripartite ATP-independent transporter DctP family solute receptor
MRKRMVCVFLVMVVCTTLLFGGGTQEEASGTTTYVLKAAHNASIDTPKHKGLEFFKENVESKTDGRVQVQIFPAGQLGDERTMIEGQQIGTVDMAAHVAGSYGQLVPGIAILELGYLFEDEEHWLSVLNGEVGDSMAEELREKGIRAIVFYYEGARVMTSNMPIRVPSDMAGMKTRVPQIETYTLAVRALGGAPTPIPWGEAYLALKTGVADGHENQPIYIYDGKMFEVQKYISLTNHIMAFGMLSINEKTFQSLPPELQEIVLEEGIKAGEFIGELNRKANEELLDTLRQEGMTVIEPDREAFREKSLPLLIDYAEDQLGSELVDKIISK